MRKNLIKNIQNFAFQHELWNKNSKILVGVSGGPDSVCLLSVLVTLQKKYNFKIHVAHVNYGLRKKDSDVDENFVKLLCEKNNLDFTILNVSKKELGNNPSENKMRDVRYNFFEKTRRQLEFNLIAVAHNQDDQAETMLMRIIRGSGLQGLRAIQPKLGVIIRPLLETSRKDIVAYLKQEKLSYRIDKTNKESVFLRNKIRNKLIPYLEKNYNPKIKQTLSSNASIISCDYDALSKSAQKKLPSISFELSKKNVASFDCQKFNQLHIAFQRQILRIIIETLKSDLKKIENRHIEEIIKISKSTKKKSQLADFKGLKIKRKGAKIYMKV
ncbi:MAG: tRNA lysidine(34) synthetase TilS [Candidatus Moranbacteria bacterium]|nr:tRNA lysidine(34) synthetase TilS [Candidatus Moranbacteria bacterium]